MAKIYLTEETLNKVLDEKLAPIQTKLNSLEKKVNALSVKDNGVKETKATTTTRSTRSTKSAKSAKTEEPAKKGKLQTLAEDFGMSLERYKCVGFYRVVLKQTQYVRDRYYLEKAMDNKGEVIKGSKYKQYTFEVPFVYSKNGRGSKKIDDTASKKASDEVIEKVLKAMQKSRNDYRKTLA